MPRRQQVVANQHRSFKLRSATDDDDDDEDLDTSMRASIGIAPGHVISRALQRVLIGSQSQQQQVGCGNGVSVVDTGLEAKRGAETNEAH